MSVAYVAAASSTCTVTIIPCPSNASGPGGEDVVLTGGNGGEELAPRLAEEPLHAIPGDGRADGAGNGEAEPGLAVGIVVTRKPVQNEVAGRRRAAAAVDGVEVLRPREPIAALHCARLRRRAACAHARAAA